MAQAVRDREHLNPHRSIMFRVVWEGRHGAGIR